MTIYGYTEAKSRKQCAWFPLEINSHELSLALHVKNTVTITKWSLYSFYQKAGTEVSLLLISWAQISEQK